MPRQALNHVPRFQGSHALLLAGDVEYQGFLGKFFNARPRSRSGYALAADKKQLRIGAGNIPTVCDCESLDDV